MKVLVTGATGFVGSEIARQLVREGHEVRVLVRKTSKLDGLKGLDFERFEGDITDRGSVERALQGVDALIHTAANVSARRRDKDKIYKANVEGTRTVLEAAHARGGLRVVYTSSVAAIGATPKPVAQTESSPWKAGDGYHYIDAKWQAEQIALGLAARGLDIVILNPGFVLGPGDVYLGSTRLVLEFLKGRLGWITDGGITFCDVRDVAKAHVAALTKGKAGERYIVASMNHTLHEALATVGRVSGMKPARRAPYPFVWLAALLSEAASLVKEHSLEEINRPVVRYGRLFNYTDSTKARRELGYEVRPFEESIRDTVKDFLARGLVEAKTPELEALATASAPELVATS
ncbi:MAG TPA: SDR family NAD(P)-dependent oxidoreductase [Planctomycetota bacterium]|nr:SDR family NAD(P)-dependent oxidoreductase [Planctomycetota bacterium]